MIRKIPLVAGLAALIGCAAVALAQTAPPAPTVRVRGAIEALDGQALVVKSRAGDTVRIALADNYAVMAVVPVALDAIKAGAYVGAASMKQADGSFKAIEILVFPESARGSGEGHYPWDLQPESMMTNATIGSVADSPQGPRLVLTNKDGSFNMTVPAGVPVVTFEPGEKTMLMPGAKVFIGTQKQPDGRLTAARVLVGKNGLTPPM
jgi:hypothetical protein